MILRVLMTTLRCVPVSSLWDIFGIGHCYISGFQLFMGSSIPHITIDILLLGFPVPLIWRLHMHSSHRIILTVLFASGILYVAFLFMSPPPRVRRQGVNLEVGLLADECSEFSVTLASIIRLIYLIKYRISLDPSIDYVKVYIWTSVEVKISIVHGT